MNLLAITLSFTVSLAAGALPAAEETAVFAGGCYWGVESVFEHVRGVRDVTSGFANPGAPTASLPDTPRHTTYAEAVRVTYDPSLVTYAQLLEIFFRVAHDPTEIDRQGPDVGPQYRSLIFAETEAQRRAARAAIDALGASRPSPQPIATEIVPLLQFRPVQASEQDFAAKNPTHPYVVINDAPKIVALRRQFPALYRNRPASP